MDNKVLKTVKINNVDMPIEIRHNNNVYRYIKLDSYLDISCGKCACYIKSENNLDESLCEYLGKICINSYNTKYKNYGWRLISPN